MWSVHIHQAIHMNKNENFMLSRIRKIIPEMARNYKSARPEQPPKWQSDFTRQ